MTDPDSDTLDGAEEMLRRIAASGCLYLDPSEAAAIVAELDRLRAENRQLLANRRAAPPAKNPNEDLS